MAHITSLVKKTEQFDGSFCCHVNQTKRQTTKYFTILNCSYPSKICTKLELYSLVVLDKLSFNNSLFKKKKKICCCHGNQTKWPLVIKQIHWVDNHLMIITAKHCSHHFTGYGENAIKPFSHFKSMGAFCAMATEPRGRSQHF